MIKKITFHRTYDIDESLIHNRLIGDGLEDTEITDEVMDCEAEIIARSYLEEELQEIDGTSDSFSCTIETIEN